MRNSKSGFIHTSLILALSLALVGFIPYSAGAVPQTGGIIDAGTTIQVRTNEEIKVSDSDGRVYSGAVDQDVTDNNGRLMIPRGSNVELVVRKTSGSDLAL